ncbi:MAG: acyl-CoA dehydrogenase family protein [Actinomycetota bacterium]|nr:acyl-CoA dehydrogenase family protein [Actinomycetota bacterium]
MLTHLCPKGGGFLLHGHDRAPGRRRHRERGADQGKTIQTTAVQDGDEWVINGHKLWLTNTDGVADLMAVVCATNPGSDDINDIAIIFVPADRPGVTQGGAYEKASMVADKNSDSGSRTCGPPFGTAPTGPATTHCISAR